MLLTLLSFQLHLQLPLLAKQCLHIVWLLRVPQPTLSLQVLSKAGVVENDP